MTKNWGKVSLSVLVAVALVLPLFAGCAKPTPPAQAITIKMGNICDLSGPVACCGSPTDTAFRDYAKYITDENRIPGVRLEVITFDCVLDPAKTAPGFQFLKDRGMHLVMTSYGHDAAIVKPLAEAARIPHIAYNTNVPVVETPGWSFSVAPLAEDVAATAAQWIIDNWDYGKMKRLPNVAHITWPTGSG